MHQNLENGNRKRENGKNYLINSLDSWCIDTCSNQLAFVLGGEHCEQGSSGKRWFFSEVIEY